MGINKSLGKTWGLIKVLEWFLWFLWRSSHRRKQKLDGLGDGFRVCKQSGCETPHEGRLNPADKNLRSWGLGSRVFGGGVWSLRLPKKMLLNMHF